MTESEARELVSKLTVDEILLLYVFIQGIEEQRKHDKVQEAVEKE